MGSAQQFHRRVADIDSAGRRECQLERRQGCRQHDALGTFEGSVPARLRWNSDGALQRPGANLLGHPASARHRSARSDGGDSLHSVFRAERFRTDADLQRRVRNALSRCRSSLAAASNIRRISFLRNFDSRDRSIAARYPGDVSDDSDHSASGSGCAARAHSTALSPLARWFRSTTA